MSGQTILHHRQFVYVMHMERKSSSQRYCHFNITIGLADIVVVVVVDDVVVIVVVVARETRTAYKRLFVISFLKC